MAENRIVLRSADNSVTVQRVARTIRVMQRTGGGGGNILSVNGQTGTVELTAGDVGAAELSHTHSQVDITDLPAVARTGSYADLTDIPTIPTPPVTSVNGRTGDVVTTKTDIGLSNVDNTSDLNKPISTATQVALNGKANASHTHATSEITGLQTALNTKADITYVDTEIASLVGSAPETMDTLNELATALGDDPNFATTISTQIGTKANSADLAPVATSGSYTDLTDTPVIPDPVNVTVNQEIARQKNLDVSGVDVLTGAVDGVNTTFTIGTAYNRNSLQVFRNTVLEPLGESITPSNPATGEFTFADAPEIGDQIYVLATAPNDGTIAEGVQSIVAGDNVTVDNTDPLNPIVSATGGGGGAGEVSYGKLFELAVTSITTYNYITSGSAQVVSGRAGIIRTLGTAGSYVYLTNDLNTDPQYFEMFKIWQYNLRASATMTNTAYSTDGLFVWGIGGGSTTATSFSPFKFVGFRVDRTAGVNTFYALNGNGSATTETQVTAPTGTNTSHWAMSVKKTQDTVEFYLNGALVATHTTNVPNASSTHHQSSPIYVGIGNKNTTQNHQVNIYGHSVDIIG